MQTFPTPKLGDISAISISTRDPEQSVAFYQTLGFEILHRSAPAYSWMVLTDGSLLILLQNDEKPYTGLTYFVKDIEQLVTSLAADGVQFAQTPTAQDPARPYLIQSPDGMNVQLTPFVEEFAKPPGHTLLTLPPVDMGRPEKYPNPVCGIFGEFAQSVVDVEQSLLFWKQLGFKILFKATSPGNWAIVSDGVSIVGLHETTPSYSPRITYFAIDMKGRIEKLIHGGLMNFSRVGEASIYITTPESQCINLFKLGL